MDGTDGSDGSDGKDSTDLMGASPHPLAPRILRLGAVTSTQDEASRRLQQGTPAPFAVTARRQTSGRGRLGRPFESPEGASLSCTYVHRTALDPTRRGWIPLVAGLSAVRALTEVTGRLAPAQVGLKWPNDLHTPDGRKLGGILVEGRGAEHVLVGIGLNLRAPLSPADGGVVPGAAWLRGEDGLCEDDGPPAPPEGPSTGEVLRESLETALVTTLREELERLESVQGDAVRAGVRDRYTMTCLTLGRRVRIDPLGRRAGGGDPPRSWSGLAREIDEHGRLVVDLEGDGRRAVDVGDVRHLRPEATAGTPEDGASDIEQEEHVT